MLSEINAIKAIFNIDFFFFFLMCSHWPVLQHDLLPSCQDWEEGFFFFDHVKRMFKNPVLSVVVRNFHRPVHTGTVSWIQVCRLSVHKKSESSVHLGSFRCWKKWNLKLTWGENPNRERTCGNRAEQRGRRP